MSKQDLANRHNLESYVEVYNHYTKAIKEQNDSDFMLFEHDERDRKAFVNRKTTNIYERAELKDIIDTLVKKTKTSIVIHEDETMAVIGLWNTKNVEV